jgi:hypothetical protein
MSNPTRLTRLCPIAAIVATAVLAAACSSSPAVATPSPSAAASPLQSLAVVSPSPSPIVTPAPTPTPTPKPTAVATPTCTASQLAARITGWDHGAGHAMATVEVTNKGSAPCRMPALDRPQLVDGHGSVILDGNPPAASADVKLAAGAVLKTLVDASNYCGPNPDAPVTVAFVFPGGATRFVATPLTPTDASGVPPCLGAPGSAGTIAMQAWAA